MSSKRFRGKMLAELGGITILERVVMQLNKSKNISKVVVATSVEESDNEIQAFCESTAISYYRGPLENVALRFVEILKKEKAAAFVRISGDSPTIDPQLVDHAAAIFNEGDFDLVSNVYPRTFPKGQSVEVLSSQKYIDAYEDFFESDHFEHVTKYFYENHGKFNIKNFESQVNYGDINLCIDNPEDISVMTSILEFCKNKSPDWKCLAEAYLHLNITPEVD